MKKQVFLLFFCLCALSLFAQDLRVGSYNIRNDNAGDVKRGDGWQSRRPVIVSLIAFYEFDIIGMQEVVKGQLDDLLTDMPQFDYIGVGRDDGKQKGEYVPILYRKDRVKLIESGFFWLGEETDKPNKGWDASLPRVCTWGIFKEKKTKKKFLFLNVHMDHQGVLARRESAKLILSKIEEFNKKLPVVLTGDFNVDQTHQSYLILRDSEKLKDSYEAATIRYALNGTFNAFQSNLMTESRIDHIFVSPSFKVKKYGILTDTYRSPKAQSKELQAGDFPQEVSFKDYVARMPSDHFPLLVDLYF